MKPGIHTTEFWLTIAVDAGAVLAAVADQLPPKWATIAATVSTGLYALARGWAKSGANPA